MAVAYWAQQPGVGFCYSDGGSFTAKDISDIYT